MPGQKQRRHHQPDMEDIKNYGVQGLTAPTLGVVRHQPVDDGPEGAPDPLADVGPVGNAVQAPVQAPDIQDDPGSQPHEEDPEGEPQQGSGDELIHNRLLGEAAQAARCSI